MAGSSTPPIRGCLWTTRSGHRWRTFVENHVIDRSRSARSMAGSSTPPIRGCLWTTRSGPTSVMAVENDYSSEDRLGAGGGGRRVGGVDVLGQGFQKGGGFPNNGVARFLLPASNGQLLGFRNFIPPYATVTDQEISTGVNYGSGVAGIRDESGSHMISHMITSFMPSRFEFDCNILARSTEWEWERIKENMSWLLDDAACVALDAKRFLQEQITRWTITMTGVVVPEPRRRTSMVDVCGEPCNRSV
ncbi:hypothetical protein L6452_34928 [Arctium lappa]|uniref:Uncharacterized protein n=1 Tax=Arctium lappa TaxID=4217 RepID=A0ACB8YK51_ARCLA|nr:hypothetical protein L6452_34928 [Arctium lappa]